MNQRFKILTNSWVITLTATLIGVFVALYLNEWLASVKLNNQKQIAKENVLAELKSNNKKLNESITKHKSALGQTHQSNVRKK